MAVVSSAVLLHTELVRVQSHGVSYRMKMLALTQIDGDESENMVHVRFSLVWATSRHIRLQFRGFEVCFVCFGKETPATTMSTKHARHE